MVFPIDGCESLVIVRAFTERGEGGNRAGVCICNSMPDDSVMLRTAAEMKLSEIAFVCRAKGAATSSDSFSRGVNMSVGCVSDPAVFYLRYFTPVCEIDLCGHATIAAFGHMFREGLVLPGLHRIVTRIGDLDVEVFSDGSVLMEQGEYRQREVKPERYALIAESLGINPSDLDSRVPPIIGSTGVEDLLIAVRDEVLLRDLIPDYVAIERLSRELGICGYHVFSLVDELRCATEDTNESYSVLCRNFAPLYGIEEESATGTSNAALAARLVSLGIWKQGVDYNIRQGMWMRQPSQIRVCMRERSWVGGNSTTDRSASR